MASSYDIKPETVLDFMSSRNQYVELKQDNYGKFHKTCALIMSHILGGPTKLIKY